MRAPILPPPAPNKGRRKRKRRSFLLSSLGFLFALGVVGFIGVSAAGGYLLWKASRDLPDYESLAKYEPPVMTRIHAHDGALIAEFARERRIFVPINAVPKLVIHAFLSAEDKHFYQHGGIDLQGMARALVNNAKHNFKGGLQGASTITQQVAKNFLLTNEQKLDRKIKEAILAIRIERAYSKDRILELYLNEIFFGMNSYGIAAAALNYFDKELKDLTIEEAAYLAALPKAPSTYNPFKNKAKATERRDWVIDEMAKNSNLDKQGFVTVTAQDAAAAKAKPLTVNLRTHGAHIFAAEFFAEEVRRTLIAQFGEDKLLTGGLSVRTTLDPVLQGYARTALTDGLVAFDRSRGWRGPVTHIDPAGDWGIPLAAIDSPGDVQPWRLAVVTKVEKARIEVGFKPQRRQDGTLPPVEEREGVEIFFDEMKWAGKFIGTDKSKGSAPKLASDVVSPGDVVWVAPKDPNSSSTPQVWTLMQVPEVGGGLVAMDPHTGRVLAIAGGFSYAISQFDRAVQAKRQPGSSFKPFVYAAALESGYKPTSIVVDAPIEIDLGPGREVWKPQNYKGEGSLGPATLRIGIEHSRNQMTARLGQDLGYPVIQEYSRRFGVYDDMLQVPAMVLGAGETTLLRMTGAYAVFANGGKEVHPTLIDRIQDRWGRTVWRFDDRECRDCKAEAWKKQAEPEISDEGKQLIDPHTAYQMTSILQGVIERGTGSIINKMLPGMPLAGKTGTTNESKDMWFMGYSPDLVCGVFLGYDNPKPTGQTATGGAWAAPVFGNFMKMALKDKRAVPFRQPPGLKMVRVDLKTGLRAGPGDKDSIWEFFKPNEEPDDASSFLGYESSDRQSGVPGTEPIQRSIPTARNGIY